MSLLFNVNLAHCCVAISIPGDRTCTMIPRSTIPITHSPIAEAKSIFNSITGGTTPLLSQSFL